MKRIIFLMMVGVCAMIISSCSTEPGFGGNSHIKGTIISTVYNDDYSEVIYESEAIDENIFIRYSNNGIIVDDISTDYAGNFQFQYLFPGEYEIYYLSDDSTSAYGDEMEVILEVNLGQNETKDLGNLNKISTIDFDEGSAVIKGRVFMINYLNSSEWPNLVVKDTSFAQEQEIYIIYGNHEYYDDRIRTNYDGVFQFQNLIKGTYTVFLYSEDITGGTEDIVITREVTITNEFEIADLGDIYIEKL